MEGVRAGRQVKHTLAGYALLIECVSSARLSIGRHDALLEPGIYVYAGSANLKDPLKRVLRHFSKRKRIKWHIDRLTERCRPLYAILAYGVSEDDVYELLATIGTLRFAIPGFGSTDKRGHVTHLFSCVGGSIRPEELLTMLVRKFLLKFRGKLSALEIIEGCGAS